MYNIPLDRLFNIPKWTYGKGQYEQNEHPSFRRKELIKSFHLSDVMYNGVNGTSGQCKRDELYDETVGETLYRRDSSIDMINQIMTLVFPDQYEELNTSYTCAKPDLSHVGSVENSIGGRVKPSKIDYIGLLRDSSLEIKTETVKEIKPNIDNKIIWKNINKKPGRIRHLLVYEILVDKDGNPDYKQGMISGSAAKYYQVLRQLRKDYKHNFKILQHETIFEEKEIPEIKPPKVKKIVEKIKEKKPIEIITVTVEIKAIEGNHYVYFRHVFRIYNNELQILTEELDKLYSDKYQYYHISNIYKEPNLTSISRRILESTRYETKPSNFKDIPIWDTQK